MSLARSLDAGPSARGRLAFVTEELGNTGCVLSCEESRVAWDAPEPGDEAGSTGSHVGQHHSREVASQGHSSFEVLVQSEDDHSKGGSVSHLEAYHSAHHVDLHLARATA